MRNIIINLFNGLLMGIAEIIPGMGAQTIAIILGIFDEIIKFLYQLTELLKSFIKLILWKISFNKFKKAIFKTPWGLGLPIFLGLVLSIITLSGLISKGIQDYPQYVLSISFGVVFVSIFIPWKEMTKHSFKEYLLVITTALIFLILFNIPIESSNNSNLLILLLGGLLSSFAGFFPGISISFGMLILGIYFPIYESIHLISSGQGSINHLLILLTFAIGLIIGVILCIRFFPILFKKFKNVLLSIITGLISASLYVTWPFIKVDNNISFENTQKLFPWEISIDVLIIQILIILVTIVLILSIRRWAEIKGRSTTSFNFENIDKD